MAEASIILAQLLGLMMALILFGEPFRLFLSRIASSFRNLGLIEMCILDVYLGGLVLYILALPPFRLFDIAVIIALLLVSATISIIWHLMLKKAHPVPKRSVERSQTRSKILEYSLVLGMFLVALYIQILPSASLIFGSIHDTSYHSILAEVIIENKYIPNTLEPYLAEGIIYPQAAHVMFAFATLLTGWAVPQAVLYVTQFFNALTVLGAYFLAKRLWHESVFGLAMVFVFTFVADWPMFITWGANPFVVGFALFLVCLGILLALLFDSKTKDKKELFVVGLLFGYLGAMVISFLQDLLVIAAIWLLAQFALRYANVKRMFKAIVFLFGVSFLPLCPFLFRFASYYHNLGHNIGLPADFAGYPRSQYWMGQSLQWSFDNLSPYPSLRIETIIVCLLSILLFVATREWEGSKRVFLAGFLSLAASVSLGCLSDVIPPDFNVVSSGHQAILLIASLYLLIAQFGHCLSAFLCRISLKLSTSNFKKPSAVLLVSILLLSAVYVPFIYTRLVVDSSTLRGAYGVFAVTGEDDQKLMLWIRNNLATNAVILVNQYEPGLFIPSVSYRKAIFATPGSQLSSSYQRLIRLLNDGTLNATCYGIMKSFGITHVYVGSVATYWWIKDYMWNYRLFLDNKHFQLVRQTGKAYLFKVLYEAP